MNCNFNRSPFVLAYSQLEKFYALCQDELWGVRKACAEVFMSLSRVVSVAKRRHDLGLLFVNLLQDETRWVRMAAFQALGPFISTFSRCAGDDSTVSEDQQHHVASPEGDSSGSADTCTGDADSAKDTDQNFNSFYYWRDPLPELDLTVTPNVDSPSSSTASNTGYSDDTTSTTTPSCSVAYSTCSATPNSSGGSAVDEGVEVVAGDDEDGDPPDPAVARESVSDSVEKALEDLMARVELGYTLEAQEGSPAAAAKDQSETEAAATASAATAEADADADAFDLRRVACQELLKTEATAASASDAEKAAVATSTSDTDADADDVSATPKADNATAGNDLSTARDTSSDSSNDGSGEDMSSNSGVAADGQSSIFQANVLLPPAYVKSDLPSGYSNSFYPYFSSRRRSDGGLDGRPRPFSPFQRNSTGGGRALSTGNGNGAGGASGRSLQDIVPQNLMDFYLQMTDPYYVETVDAEITRHCAYSLPAVVCTLGREHWPLLRDLYGTLASDMQWKVRRTLASSIHEIGAILGPDVVAQDLVPVFDELIKDLDEVRIGVLKHLGEFLRLLPSADRRSYLPRLADFLKLDNEQNWRFRQELALQLQTVVSLFSPPDIAQSILPLALALAADRVAAVRIPAFTLVSRLPSPHSPGTLIGATAAQS